MAGLQKIRELTIDTMIPRNFSQNEVDLKTYYFYQGDINSAKFLLNITHEGAEQDLSTATKVQIAFLKPDGKRVFQDCSNVNPTKGKYYVVLNTQSITTVGNVVAQIRITFPDTVVETTKFVFAVAESIMSDGAVESSDEFPAIQKAIEAGEKLEGKDIDGIIAAGTKADTALAKSIENTNQIGILSKPRTFIGEKFPVYISHNGFNYIAPINCLPAYELAAEAGYKYFEVDVRTTKDNVWMAFHDDDIAAMTDGTGLFKDKTLLEAKTLTIDTMLTTYPGTKIPTFEEFLSLCTKWNATPVIEVKVYNNDTNLSDLITILKDTGYLNNCIVMAFGMGTLTKLRDLNKELALCLLSNTAEQADIDNAKLIDSDYVSVNKSVITKNFCQLAHKSGLKIGAWTTDSEEEARNLTALGVDIITTNSLLPRGV